MFFKHRLTFGGLHGVVSQKIELVKVRKYCFLGNCIKFVDYCYFVYFSVLLQVEDEQF